MEKLFGEDMRARYREGAREVGSEGPGGSPRCKVVCEGKECPWEALSVRTMNFGQHWRTPGVVEVQYALELPFDYFADFARSELPEYIADAREHPSTLPLDEALRARGWPDVEEVLRDQNTATLALEYFASDLLLHWLGDGLPAQPGGYILNSVDRVSLDGGRVRVEGTGRRDAGPAAYQDV